MREPRQLAAGVLALWVLSFLVSVSAQTPSTPFERLNLTVGRSQVLATDFDVERIAVTNPTIADALAVHSREILIDGKAPGTISLILWGDSRRVQYDVVVAPGTSALQQQLQAIFPGEDIRVGATDEAIVLSGKTTTKDVAMRAFEIAQASSTKMKVVNFLQPAGGPDAQQVMLEVRFAEVEHNALMDLGVSFTKNRWVVPPAGPDGGRISTQQFPAPFVDGSPNPVAVTEATNLFYVLSRENLLFALRALQQRRQLQTLAEPNLIAYNGQEASFLAGGEFPIPVVQGGTSNAVTVVFKEFGVRLNFTPLISGDLIRLKVRPEVSTLDFANGLQISGFLIPALTTRRAETIVELNDGQSFAIAGLLNNTSQEARAGVPWLSSLPIIGPLFKSKAENATRTELLVLITPHLVRPLEPSEVPPLPTNPKLFLKPSDNIGGALEGGGGLVDAPPVAEPPKAKK